MTLEELIEAANSLADDLIPEDEVQEFVNDAIAAINVEVGANFPFLLENEDVPAFPEKWQRMLIIPFTKGRIKEKDSSQFEWEVAYEQFFANLESFKVQYEIPDDYKDPNSNSSIGPSILENKPYVWGGW